jgi:uncharacterized membrane protein
MNIRAFAVNLIIIGLLIMNFTPWCSYPMSGADAEIENFSNLQQNIHRTSRSINDVGIEHIWDIEHDILGIDHPSGGIVHFNVSVRNYGDIDIVTPFKIILNITDDGSPQYLFEENKSFPTCIGLAVMKAQTAYNVSWSWESPTPDKMPPGSQNDLSKNDVTFTATFNTEFNDDPNTINDQKSINVIIRKPIYKLRLKHGWWWKNGSKYDWSGERINNIEIELGKSNQFELKFTLENLGDPVYIIYETTTPTGWIAIPPTRRHWGSGTNSSKLGKNLSITVFPPTNLEHLKMGKNYKITLKALCEGYQIYFDTLEFIIRVNSVPNPVIVIPGLEENNNLINIKPPMDVLMVQVYNRGNDIDNFELLVETRNRAMGWSAELIGDNYTQYLNPGEFENFKLKITVSSAISADTSLSLVLTAKSLKSPNHPNAVVQNFYYILVDQVWDVRFDEDEQGIVTEQMYPASETNKVLSVINMGNKLDKTIMVNVTTLPQDWIVVVDSSDIPHTGLAKNGTADIEVLIKTPTRVQEGGYYINLTAYSNNEPKDEISIPVQILKEYNLSLQCKKPRNSGDVDSEINYSLIIENTGNTNDIVQLSHSYSSPGMQELDWRVSITPQTMELLAYEKMNVTVTVFVPSNALADLDFETPRRDGYLLTIMAESLNSEIAVTEKNLEIVVRPFYDFELDRHQETVHLVKNDKGSSIDYSFKLTNLGNDLDLYEFRYESENGQDWLVIPFTQRLVLPGTTLELFYYFDSPWLKDSDEYKFIIYCRSIKKPSIQKRLELSVIIQVLDIKVTEIQVGDEPLEDAELEEGETVLLRAKLENAGEINYSSETFGDELKIHFYESSGYIGEANITFLPSQENKNDSNHFIWVSVPWTINKARDYQIIVELDPNKSLPDSNTDNNKFSGSMEISPSDKPSFDGDGWVIIIAIIILIIIFIICSIIIFLRKRRRLQKELDKYADEEIELFEDRKSEKAKLVQDLKFEQDPEPENGVIPLTKNKTDNKINTRNKFLSEKINLEFMKPIKKMQPVKKVKPVKRVKPLHKTKPPRND